MKVPMRFQVIELKSFASHGGADTVRPRQLPRMAKTGFNKNTFWAGRTHGINGTDPGGRSSAEPFFTAGQAVADDRASARAPPIAQLSRISRIPPENPMFFSGSGEKKCEKKSGK